MRQEMESKPDFERLPWAMRPHRGVGRTRGEYALLLHRVEAKWENGRLMAYIDHGTGPEAGNIFEYCSAHCMETH